jgi:flagellar M-ring protein FliF
VNIALEILTKLGPGRILAMIGVTLSLVAFFAFVMLRVSQPAMGVLYTDLSTSDAAAVMKDLDARAIRYETRNEGQTILAPRSDLARIRMDMAQKGLPTGGGVGYEIFDKGDAFSSTSFVQNINQLRALEGELSRTIRSLSRVEAARVHLVIPEKRLFSRDREQPRASIVLKLRGELEPGQVRAIRHLAATAVEGLRPDRVSIVDERGRLLADGAQTDIGVGGAAAEEKQAGLQQRLKTQVEEIVTGIVGIGRARVQVAAELDFNRIENRTENFDPEGRVVRSTQNRTESQLTNNAENAVSAGNELPGTNTNGGANTARDAANKNEEIVNYEISRSSRTEIVEGGRLKRLSVAVLVDGLYTNGTNGETSWQPRSPEELERIAALVRTAIGFDKTRGDQVEVVNLRFADAPQKIDSTPPSSLVASVFMPTRDDILRFIELGVIAVLTLLVLLMVVRPMLRKALDGSGVGGSRRGGRPGGTMGGEGGSSQLSVVKGNEPNLVLKDNATARLIEEAKNSGLLQSQTIEQVGELVESSPTETIGVIRQWLYER